MKRHLTKKKKKRAYFELIFVAVPVQIYARYKVSIKLACRSK